MKSNDFYDRIQKDYTYFEKMLDLDDVTLFREEIMSYHKRCMFYVTAYDEAIYGQFLRLLNQLIDKM